MDQPTINSPSPEGQNEPTPFEMPPDISEPEPMGGQATSGSKGAKSFSGTVPPRSPAPPGPPRPIFSYLIIGFLVLMLIIGIVVFAGFQDWISLGGIFGKKEATPTPMASMAFSPAISPFASPSASPQVISNVNDETRKKDLAIIKSGLRGYYRDKSSYPVSTALIKTSDSSSVLASSLVPTYLQKLPDDPLAPQYYYGYKSADGTSFELTAALEDKSDSSGILMGQLNIYKITDVSVE